MFFRSFTDGTFEYPLFQGIKMRAGPNMKTLILRFIKEESGATAIEYGLIAAGIAIAIITAVQGVGTALNGNFSSISTSLK
jgi:pilus assembly protein Flp/PilA